MIQPLKYGKYYHIYNRGINSDILFKEKSNFQHFLNLYDEHINPIAETYAWCLMKNHFHFLVRIKEIEEITSTKKVLPSQTFSNLFNAYTKAYNKWHNRHGSLFERPFRRKQIDYDNYFQNVISYIHNNPVHHRICEHPLEYPWSSYLSCVSEKPTKLQREKVMELFNGLENFKSIHTEKVDCFAIESFLGI
ncbi:transposase [Flavobacterium filum]|uniref:transposase n=2 Tax=Flavobacteriaceae TaxID=49546 RepID=UPI0003F715EC|nr:transposase [Flavobacterium filum]